MYEAFFGLNARPFADRPDPDFFVESDAHGAALRALGDGLETAQPLMVITGDTGCGKTMLARALLAGLGDAVTVGLITNPHASVSDLTPWALLSFGQETQGHTDAELQELLALYFVSEFGAGRKCLLVIDEAQNLTPSALAGLQHYLDINADGECLLQVLLVAAPRLLRTLSDPALAHWTERLPLICRAGALPLEDVPSYIGARLAVAGARRAIFTDRAIAAIAIASGGVPRLINAICDMALIYAFGRRCDEIARDLIADVVAEGQVAGFGALAMLSPIDGQEAATVALDLSALPLAEPDAATVDVARFTESLIVGEAEPILIEPPAPEAEAAAPRLVQPEISGSEIGRPDLVLRELSPLSGAPPEQSVSAMAAPIITPQSSIPEPSAASMDDPPPSMLVPAKSESAYSQALASWPSITGRNDITRFARAVAAAPVTGGTSLRRRFLPRD